MSCGNFPKNVNDSDIPIALNSRMMVEIKSESIPLSEGSNGDEVEIFSASHLKPLKVKLRVWLNLLTVDSQRAAFTEDMFNTTKKQWQNSESWKSEEEEAERGLESFF